MALGNYRSLTDDAFGASIEGLLEAEGSIEMDLGRTICLSRLGGLVHSVSNDTRCLCDGGARAHGSPTPLAA